MRAILIIAGLGMTVFGAVILATASEGHRLTTGGSYAAGAVICFGGIIATGLAGAGAARPPREDKRVNPRDNGKRR